MKEFMKKHPALEDTCDTQFNVCDEKVYLYTSFRFI